MAVQGKKRARAAADSGADLVADSGADSAAAMPAKAPAKAPAKGKNTPGEVAKGEKGSYLALAAFLAFYLVATLVGRVPQWLGGLYVGASIFCFIVYGLDKNAAIAGRQRVSENTLILIGLAGGWPGAIVAQQLLRHKSVKAEFRSAFWGSVGLNVLIFSAFTLPSRLLFA